MPEKQELIAVARLMKPHGVKGDIKTEPLSHEPNRLRKLSQVTLQLADHTLRPVRVVHASPHGPVWHLRIEGYETPEAAAELNNALVLISAQERLPAPKGEYYTSDLEGLSVLDETGKVRGKVISIVELPSVNSLELRINGIEVIAPWIKDCVGAIDLEARTVSVNFEFLYGVYPQLEQL